jgi:hypothetical protein
MFATKMQMIHLVHLKLVVFGQEMNVTLIHALHNQMSQIVQLISHVNGPVPNAKSIV